VTWDSGGLTSQDLDDWAAQPDIEMSYAHRLVGREVRRYVQKKADGLSPARAAAVPPVSAVRRAIRQLAPPILARCKADPVSWDTELARMTGPRRPDRGTKPRKPATPPEPSSTASETELPERWSVQRKSELVLRLLRGDTLDAVSRESQVPAHELESWKRIFLEQGTRGLKTRSDPEERELTLARAKIGELMMRLELAEHLIEKRGLTDEWKKQRR
jgi:hypothetical protein